MKKMYTKPTAEKLSFRYRDQVVAASGDSNLPGNTPSTGEQIIGQIAQGLGISGCESFECTSLANLG